MANRKMHPAPPDLSSSTGTPTPGSTVVTPSIVLPPELRPLTSKSTNNDPGFTTPSASNPADLDLSLPLSTLLRESTKIAHTQAEHSPGAIALASGTLPFREYVRYLTSLWIVYSILEREIARHSRKTGETEEEGEVLALLWDEGKGGKGRMLSRSESLAQDITYLLSLKPSLEWTLDPRDATQPTTSIPLPLPPFPVPPFLSPLFTSPPPAITTFITHLRTISATRPALLLAHAYVRYLGDLSGGQLVRSKIRRVYALDPTDTSSQVGTQFYEFDIFDSGDRPVGGELKQPTMYERKQRMTDIKEWFRGVLDSGTADGKEELKRALVDEAIECFHLSTHIFSALRPTPAQTDKQSPTETTPPAVRQMQRKPDTPVTWQSFTPILVVFAVYAAWIAYNAAKAQGSI